MSSVLFLLLLSTPPPMEAWKKDLQAITEEVTPCPYQRRGELRRLAGEAQGMGPAIPMEALSLGPLWIEGGSLPEVECRPGAVTLTGPGGAGALDLQWVEAERRFRLGADIDRRLEAAERRAAGAPGALEEARAWLSSLEWVPELAGSQILRARRLVLREEIAAGRWSAAEETAARMEGDAPARDRLRVALRAARARSAPVRVIGPMARIGKMQSPEPPSWEGASLFWRAQQLCAIRADDQRSMRCFDGVARRWLPPEPAVLPRLPTLVPRGGGRACEYRETWSLPEDSTEDPCGGFERSSVLAVLAGPSVLVAGREAILNDRRETLAPGAITSALRGSAGSRIFGQGELLLLEGAAYRRAADPDRSWHLAEAPPDPEHQWARLPGLASPDQSLVVLFSWPKTGGAWLTLWLAAVAPPLQGK